MDYSVSQDANELHEALFKGKYHQSMNKYSSFIAKLHAADNDQRLTWTNISNQKFNDNHKIIHLLSYCSHNRASPPLLHKLSMRESEGYHSKLQD